jgi:hypothetical protein
MTGRSEFPALQLEKLAISLTIGLIGGVEHRGVARAARHGKSRDARQDRRRRA